MFNQQQLEKMGFEFRARDVDGAQMFSWNFTVGGANPKTAFMGQQTVVRESAVPLSTMQAAINDAIVTGDQFDLAKCGNCDHVCDVSDLKDIKNYNERVAPGEVEPLGECPRCGSLSYDLQLLPDFDEVIQYFGLDTSFQYDNERILQYSADYIQAVKQAEFNAMSKLAHHESIGYEKAINDVIDRLARLIVRAEQQSVCASKTLGTMAQVGANATLSDYKKAFLVAIGQGKCPAGELTLIQALEKVRGTHDEQKPAQASCTEYGIIRSVHLKTLTKDEVDMWPSLWNWLGANSQSRRTGEDVAHSSFEFILNLEHLYYDAPLALTQLIEEARSNNVSYLRFYG